MLRRSFLSVVPGTWAAMGGIGAPLTSTRNMVSSESRIATQVGLEILQKGGNAVDAAIAIGFAEAVTLPRAGNLGGGGFMLIQMADGRATSIDYRVQAPNRATRNMFLDSTGKLIQNEALFTHRAACVPGTVAGFSLALERYGKLPWSDLVRPAERLASDGFIVTPYFAQTLRENEKRLNAHPETRRIFLRGGKFYDAGELFHQPELGQTLTNLAQNGPREFYQGRTAALIVREMKHNAGLITADDLRDYRAVERTPLRATYRGHSLLTMPLPSSGGLLIVQMLNMLEGFELGKYGSSSPEANHLLIEVMRRAFADRAEFMGDPDYVRVPVQELASKQYAQERARSIDYNRATPSAQIGHGNPEPHEVPHTTHYSVVDSEGNAVSNTYTLGINWAGGLMITGAGFLINNNMDDFAAKPGEPNYFGFRAGEANAIASGKRPVSSMAPTIVLEESKPSLIIGSPGGTSIPNAVLQVLVNVLDHRLSIQQAIEAPRLHHQWLPDVVNYETARYSSSLLDGLRAKGHKVEPYYMPYIGVCNGVAITGNGLRIGSADPRNPDGEASGA